jgi:hypothetical protein
MGYFCQKYFFCQARSQSIKKQKLLSCEYQAEQSPRVIHILKYWLYMSYIRLGLLRASDRDEIIINDFNNHRHEYKDSI